MPDAPPHYLWCGVVIGLVFTIGMLGLNVSILAQIFGLANFAYFYMSFMKGHAAGFSSGWEINTKGAAVSNVMVCQQRDGILAWRHSRRHRVDASLANLTHSEGTGKRRGAHRRYPELVEQRRQGIPG